MAQAHQNIDEATSSKRKLKQMKNMPPPLFVGTNGSRCCAMGPTLARMYGKLNRDDTNDAIGKIIFANGIPFHVSRSPYYNEMVNAIAAAGPSYVPPSKHKLSAVILERNVANINVQNENSRQKWTREG